MQTMEAVDPVAQPASIQNYIHLIVISCFYTLLVFACWFVVDSMATRANFMAIGIALSGATGMLVAVWSVFGPGKLVVRVLVANAIGAPVIIVNAYGHWSMSQNLFFDNVSFSASLQTSLLLAYSIAVAMQVPLWLIRFLRGWRLSFRGGSSAASVPLSELFVLTCMFALAFATPEIADKIIINSLLEELKVGGEFEDVELLSANSWQSSMVTVSEQNIEKLRSNIKTHDFIYHMSPTIYGAAFGTAICSLLFSPVILIMFRARSWRRAIVFVLLFAIGLATLSSVSTSFAIGNATVASQIIVEQILLIVFGLFGFAIPLLISRGRGFELHSYKLRKSSMQSTKEAEQNMETVLAQ